MAIDKLTVRIDTPSESVSLGRGFYQIEEDVLFVPIGKATPSRKAFFSYLESDIVRLDIDRFGRLLFVEVSAPRRQWDIMIDLRPPRQGTPGDVRWLDFREQIPEPALISNLERTILQIRFSTLPAVRAVGLASGLTLEVADDDTATSLWVTEIVDDAGGKQIAAFRAGDPSH